MFNTGETKNTLFLFLLTLALVSCGGGSSSGGNANNDDDNDTPTNDDDDPVVSPTTCTDPVTEIHGAFLEIMAQSGGNVEATLSADGCTVVVTTNGLPNHESIYWNPTHPLYDEPTATQTAQKTPTVMDDTFANDVSLTVWATPELAASTTAPGIGSQGISVSGGFIYSKYEGRDPQGNFIDLDLGVAGGLDNDGAHIGPTVYHYHLEPTANIVVNGDELIGVMNDGFFLYGQIDWETGEIPDDLDESGGHVGLTPYSNGVEEYHYHVQEEFMTTGLYFAFPFEFRGEIY